MLISARIASIVTVCTDMMDVWKSGGERGERDVGMHVSQSARCTDTRPGGRVRWIVSME